MKRHGPLLGYFGHHKAGSSWILNVIGALCSDIGLRSGHFHSPRVFNYDLATTVKEQRLNFVCYSNADISYVRPILQDVRGFHVIRDPRDIVVSAYFSHRRSHSDEYWPELANYRQKLEALPKEEGLMLTMEHLRSLMADGAELDIFDHVSSWDYSLPNVMEVKFEELILNPYTHFLDILRFLGILDESSEGLRAVSAYVLKQILFRTPGKLHIPVNARFGRMRIPPWRVLHFVYENDFSRLSSGRRTGSEDREHHYRKGIAGDWKNHFLDEHKQYFKKHYGSLLQKLGYEKNNEW